MGTKEKLLELFEANKGIYFSGEELASKLAVSRTAVWKGVNSLRGEGYKIDAGPNRGYSLSVNTDILSAQGIKKYLAPVCKGLTLDVRRRVSSTNALLREQAAAGAPDGYTILALSQTAGRGRLGRTFYSPEDTGVYMSILLRPENMLPEQAVKLTTMAAVAACEAIEALLPEQAGIKWVNDIYMRGKKVSGILTEGAFGLESGNMDYIVLGIGFNVYPPQNGFPADISSVAGWIFNERIRDGKNMLSAGFLNGFMSFYKAGEDADYISRYRERSFVIGKEINVLYPEGARKALALDVDENCRLVVQFEDGCIEKLSSGEISVRLC